MPTRPGSWSACEPPRDEGLVPAPDDDQLFISFQTALRLLMLEHPGLRRGHGPPDRAGRSTQDRAGPGPRRSGRHRGLAAAILRHAGRRCCPANGWAIGPWLPRILPRPCRGTTKVSAGRRPPSSPTLPPGNASSRPCSVSAQGQPPTQPVSLGGVKVSPEKFEGWIRDQLSRRRIAGGSGLSRRFAPRGRRRATGALSRRLSFGQLNDSAGRGFKGDELPVRIPTTSIGPGGT